MHRLNAVTVYLIITATSAFAFAAAFTNSAVYRFESAHLDPLQLVLLGTVLEASIFLFEIPTGLVADLRSRRLSVVIGYGLIGAGMLLEGAFPVFATILLAQIVWGIGYTFISGAEDAWLADEIGEDRLTAVYLRGSQVASIATLCGIAANIPLANRQLALPYLAGGLAHLGLALFLPFFMPERHFHPAPQEERESWGKLSTTFRAGLSAISARPLLVTILGISLIYGLYSEVLDRLWQPHFLANITPPTIADLSPVTFFGLLKAALLLATIFTADIARRRLSGVDGQRMAIVLAVLSAAISVGLILFGIAKHMPLALLSFSAIAVARATLHPLYSAWVNRGIPSAVRATVLSTFGQMDAIGQVIGGPLLGVIANNAGMPSAFIAAGLLLSPVLLLYRRAFRQSAMPAE